MGSLYQGAISTFEANGHVNLPAALIGDLYDIDRRIKEGDESGWRGDPTMCICFNQHTQMFEVVGKDRAGKDYIAASHHTLDHTLLIKLREGDPQRGDPFRKVLEHNEKLRAEQERKDTEKRHEIGEKLQWGIRQDFAQHLGGRGRKTSFNVNLKES